MFHLNGFLQLNSNEGENIMTFCYHLRAHSLFSILEFLKNFEWKVADHCQLQ